jgi:uncharacterized protein (DUF362 family)
VYDTAGAISAKLLSQMVEQAICKLTGLIDATEAWASLFSPRETIGIKVNALGGRNICTHHEVAYTVAGQLTRTGIKPSQIIIWDRLSSELAKGGYTVRRNADDIQCYGTDTNYEHTPEFAGSIGSCFSRIIAQQCDAIISIPVLKDHDLAGISVNLKNFYGAIHNPNKYHDNGCNPYVADLNSHPYIKNKIRLIICDGLVGQYNGGPGFKPQWSWHYNGLLLSRDPVAIDQVGLQLIEEQRGLNGLPSLTEAGRYPAYIKTAEQLNLGFADPNKIVKIEL